MSYLLVWVPTFAAVLVLMVAALLLDLSIKRDERRKAREGPDQ